MLITQRTVRGVLGLHLLAFQEEKVVGCLVYINTATGVAYQKQLDGSLKRLEGVRAFWTEALSPPSRLVEIF